MKKSHLIILFCSMLSATLVQAVNQKKPDVTAKRQRCCPDGECIKKERTTKRSAPTTSKPKAQSVATIDRLSQAAH